MSGEQEENLWRKDLSRSEAVDLSRALEEEERCKARERQLTGKAAERGGPSEQFPEGPDKGRAMDRVAEAVGMSRPTLTKARAAGLPQ